MTDAGLPDPGRADGTAAAAPPRPAARELSPAERLRQAAVDALALVADQLPEVPPGTRVDPAERLVVRSTHVRAALGCPAAVALAGEEPFEESAAVAGWAAAATVADRLVHGHRDPNLGRPPTEPATGFRAVWRERAAEGWPWTWLDGATDADRALTAAEVHRRLAALARTLGAWPPAGASHVGHRPSWTFPNRPLVLQGRVDLVLGRRDGSHTLVVALGGDHDGTTRARLAYEAAVEALALRRPPAAVLALLPDAGRRWQVPVDDALLAHGVATAALAAATALGTRRRDPAGLARRPGTRCRSCTSAASCEPGRAWLDGPGRLLHGFLPAG